MRVWRAGELSLILLLRSCRIYMLKNTDYFIPPPAFSNDHPLHRSPVRPPYSTYPKCPSLVDFFRGTRSKCRLVTPQEALLR